MQSYIVQNLYYTFDMQLIIQYRLRTISKHPFVKTSNYPMPVLSNIPYSSVLKMVSLLCKANYPSVKTLAATGNPYLFLYNNPPHVIFKKIIETDYLFKDISFSGRQ